MQFGPAYIYECSNCGNLLRRVSLQSGNNFGELVYSDGNSFAPMLWGFPQLVKCPKCQTFLWMKRLKEVGQYDLNEKQINPSWKNAHSVSFLDIDDYYLALEKIKLNKKNEIFIRIRIWWEFNNKLRDGDKTFDLQEERHWEKNCERLLELLKPTNINMQITIAELYRNLGAFEKCMELIQAINDDDYAWIKNIFMKECGKQNKYVVRLKREEFM